MTIYALSSGPGISGIAVIRISGAKVKEIVKLITNGTCLLLSCITVGDNFKSF